MKPTMRRSNFSRSTNSTILETAWPGITCASSFTCAAFACLREIRMISSNIFFASASSSSTISSTEVGNRGNSSTQTMSSDERSRRASSIAATNALAAPDELRSHLDREKNDNETSRGGHSVEIHQRSRLEKIEWRQNRKRDDTHAMWQFWIVKKRRSQSHANEIGRQYRFAARDGGEPAECQQHE